jgi:hypothetical protein
VYHQKEDVVLARNRQESCLFLIIEEDDDLSTATMLMTDVPS